MYEAKAALKNCVRFAAELPERPNAGNRTVEFGIVAEIEDENLISR
jgi:hypothetical protein